MIQRLKIYLISASVLLNIVIPIAVAGVAKADIQHTVCGGVNNLTIDSSNGNCTQGGNQLQSTTDNIINLLSVVVGIVAVIMIIVAGFRYITSGGNEQSIASAKKTLLYAIIGLVIAALAQVIARFVLNKTT